MVPDRTSALFWSLFAGGAFVVALLLPIHILLFHFGSTLGILEEDPLAYDALITWLASPLVKLYIIILIGGSLFHGAHRFKYVLFDWGMTRAYRSVGLLLYAIAILGTLAALYVAFLGP
ncbi:MAG: hypothetical protein V3W22_06625 [Thermoplasmata archaeon]